MESRRISPNPTGIGQIANQLTQAAQQQSTFDDQVQPTTQLPAEGASGTFYQNFGKFERPGSTFSWKIFRPGREKLVGYSKPRGMAEKANKQELLLDCIRRLANRDYIREGLRVEFYRNFSDDDNDSVKLMTMYGSRFVAEPPILQQAWLIKFLSNFYNPIVYNYNAGELFPTGGQSTPPEGKVLVPDGSGAKDPFDLSRRFKTSDSLLQYIEQLTLAGHPHGRITAFYQEKIKYFHDRDIKPIR